MKKRLLSIAAFLVGFSSVWSQGFTVSGTQLKDANGNNFIMKGVSVPLSWFASDVNNNIANIRTNTGSNCLRIVVNNYTSDVNWQTCVQKCIDNKMVPMVELHDVTCSTSASSLLNEANFWASKTSYLTRDTIAKYILINIANEWGDWNLANSNQVAWSNAYKDAITAIRNAGINTTLVIDAPGCGQDIRNGETLRNYAAGLQTYDPKHNLLFSVHMYCEWAVTSSTSIVSTGLPSIKNAGVPIIVGEFGYQHDNGSGGVCDVPETTILNTCESNGIGWLAWSWKGNGSPVTYLDISNDWAGTNLSTWGSAIVNGTNGTKTAVTASIFNASTPVSALFTSPLSIYPNPAKGGNFTINVQHPTIISIYNLQGKLVFTTEIKGDKENISTGLTSGLYILKTNELIQKLVIE